MSRNALIWKVYNERGQYVGATKFTAEAAMLVAALGAGARVKLDHHTLVWTEGKETKSAMDSYDDAGVVMIARVNAQRAESRRRADELARRVTPDNVACLKYDDGTPFAPVVLNSACTTYEQAEALLAARQASGHTARPERVAIVARSAYDRACAELLKLEAPK